MTSGEHATDRRVIGVSGPEARDFLQGLVSNDIRRISDAPVYAALLSPQGKYLADFLIVAQGDSLLIDVHEALASDLLRRLTMYRLRAKVEVAELPLAVLRGTGEKPADAVQDPRHPALGWRQYVAQEQAATAQPPATDWDAIRVAHCIPESLIELVPNETYLLEAGFERLHGVDFRKGCYVGQEVTARMKHKTELRKGLVQVAISGSAPAGTEIRAGDKSIGTLFTQSGERALAHLRFDRMSNEMTAGEARLRPLPEDETAA